MPACQYPIIAIIYYNLWWQHFQFLANHSNGRAYGQRCVRLSVCNVVLWLNGMSYWNKKAQLTQRERATAVRVWRPTANRCKIRKKTSILVLKVIQGHCFQCQSKPVYDFILVINCNLGPISHRFRDMATFRFKSLPRGRYSRSRSSKVIDLGLNGKPFPRYTYVYSPIKAT